MYICMIYVNMNKGVCLIPKPMLSLGLQEYPNVYTTWISAVMTILTCFQKDENLINKKLL